MATKVHIPSPLRPLTRGETIVEAPARDIADLLDKLEARYPGIKARLCDETGELKRFINIFVNGEDMRALQGIRTSLKEGDEVFIIPAMAGGGS
jgi:molybdopterin synthase sulfur carrier subunit